MRYYVLYSCGHSRTRYRKVFTPRIGDYHQCEYCRERVQVTEVRPTDPVKDKTVYAE